MNDNARIVREALHRMAAAMEVYGPAPVAVKTPLEDRPIYGLYPFKALAALETELATTHADLMRAREEERERIIGIITDPHNNILWIAPGSSRVQAIHADPRMIRAALAPEQKGTT